MWLTILAFLLNLLLTIIKWLGGLSAAGQKPTPDEAVALGKVLNAFGHLGKECAVFGIAAAPDTVGGEVMTEGDLTGLADYVEHSF